MLAPHGQCETDLEICYFMVKGLNIDYCIWGGRMFFILLSGFQIAVVLHKHLGVPNTKKTDMMELNKRSQPASRYFPFFFLLCMQVFLCSPSKRHLDAQVELEQKSPKREFLHSCVFYRHIFTVLHKTWVLFIISWSSSELSLAEDLFLEPRACFGEIQICNSKLL